MFGFIRKVKKGDSDDSSFRTYITIFEHVLYCAGCLAIMFMRHLMIRYRFLLECGFVGQEVTHSG